jgi:hypothetical protein
MSQRLQQLRDALGDRYRLEREIGAGGMATVYLAHDSRHDRNVAVKVLKPELAAVLGAERFITEIRTTAALQHPHILPLFDSGEADGFLFYVLPFIDGETLRAKLDRERPQAGMATMTSFLDELKRRRVVRVAGVYAGSVFAAGPVDERPRLPSVATRRCASCELPLAGWQR